MWNGYSTSSVQTEDRIRSASMALPGDRTEIDARFPSLVTRHTLMGRPSTSTSRIAPSMSVFAHNSRRPNAVTGWLIVALLTNISENVSLETMIARSASPLFPGRPTSKSNNSPSVTVVNDVLAIISALAEGVGVAVACDGTVGWGLGVIDDSVGMGGITTLVGRGETPSTSRAAIQLSSDNRSHVPAALLATGSTVVPAWAYPVIA